MCAACWKCHRVKNWPFIHRGGVSDHLPGQAEAEQEVGGQQQQLSGVSGAAASTGRFLLHGPWKHPEAPAPPPNCHLCYQGNVEVHASCEMPNLKYEHRPNICSQAVLGNVHFTSWQCVFFLFFFQQHVDMCFAVLRLHKQPPILTDM